MAKAAAGSRELIWVQPSLTTIGYVLRDDDAEVARLEFEPVSGVRWALTDPKAARATSGEGRWRFTVSRPGIGGFFGMSATVSVAGTNRATIELRNALSRGELRVDARRSYQWDGKITRNATSTFALPDAAATALVRFRTGSPADKIVSRLELTPAGARVDEWPLLAALGLYLRIIMGRTWQ